MAKITLEELCREAVGASSMEGFQTEPRRAVKDTPVVPQAPVVKQP